MASTNQADGSPSLSNATPVGYRSLLPRKWQRLQQQLEGRPYELPQGPANVTLADLIKETEQRLAAQSDEIDTDITQPFEPGQTVPGWIGTPDPTKYAPGTTYLSPAELAEEEAKGNVVAADDWRAAIAEMEPWERELFQQQLLGDYANDRLFFEVQGDGEHPGGRVSFAQLLQYTQFNPQLRALAERQRSIIDEGGADVAGLDDLRPFRGRPDDPYLMDLTEQQMRGLPWTCVGSGTVWKRRPTRWLRGLDGQMDCMYAVFVHEAQAQKLLGPTWSGASPGQALSSTQYWEDVRNAGPSMGMTFMVAAARDLPINEAAQRWQQLIQQRMAVQGAGQEAVDFSLNALAQVMDVKRLMAESKLLNPLGTHVREGSTLVLTMVPGGRMLVQAMTGDPVKSRKHYLLGAIHGCQALCSGLTSLALGGGPDQPQQPPLDEDIVQEAGAGILAAAHGAREAEAAQQPSGIPFPLGARLGAPKPSMFRLPLVGKTGHSRPPAMLSGVQEEVSLYRLGDVFVDAARAADDASSSCKPDTPDDEVVAVRRAAAQQALARGLQHMGLDVHVSAATGGQPGSLLSTATPLQG